MAKTLIEAFDDVFAKEVRRARNYSEAYERAAQDFQNVFQTFFDVLFVKLNAVGLTSVLH